MLTWNLVLLLVELLASRSFVDSSVDIGTQDRLDCWLNDEVADQTACQALGCVWDDAAAKGIPQCFFPKAGYGYKVVSSWSEYIPGFSLDLERLPARSRFGSDSKKLKFHVKYYGSAQEGYNTIRFKFTDPDQPRYEVPVFKHLDEQGEFPGDQNRQNSKYQLVYGNDDVNGFHLKVVRTDGSKATIFDTSIGGLTFSDQFLQLATYLPQNSSLYGIGESPHHNYKHNMNYQTWPLFSRDVSPEEGFQNLYGVHPFYMSVESDGRAHGLFFVNSNAMEYTTLPAPGVSIRTTGGILDFFLFVGDSPTEVTRMYQNIIGRTFMPPYWALGFQLSRWGYMNLKDIQTVVDRQKANKVPHDVQYADIDYMDQKKDFTYDKKAFAGMDKYINDTKKDGLRWVLILDPAILATDKTYEAYVEGEKKDVFVHWPKDIPETRRDYPPNVDTTKGVMYGNVWPNGPAAFPDFFKNETHQWWKDSIGSLYKDLKFDGLWIDMNEPSNFLTNVPKQKSDPWHLVCPTNMYDDPAYLPVAARTWGKGTRLSEKTICMASVQGDQGQYRHYDVHSLYGWSEMEPTQKAAQEVTGERSMVFSRSTYPSSGKHGGHWLGDNFSRWVDLHRSIIGMLEFNLFGIPYIGADICGFNDNTTPEMCRRWMQLGAFYPLSRNHNTMLSIAQDPAGMGGDVLAASVRALNVRYTLLPYLYTLFHASHTRGSKVLNALVDLYPKDKATHDVDTQFLWGDGLLIAPVLQEGQKSVNVYLPNDDWLDYYTKLKKVTRQSGDRPGQYLTVTNLQDIPLYVRGGTVFPTQAPAGNTQTSRKNPFTLEVYPTSNSQAVGELFWDDGVTTGTFEKHDFLHLNFQFNKTTFTISPDHPGSVFKDSILIKSVVFYDTTTASKTAKVTGKSAPVPIATNAQTKSISVDINTTVSKTTGEIKIQW